MKEKHASREGMTWVEMDVLDLKYDEGEFDLVLDKGRTPRGAILNTRSTVPELTVTGTME